MDAPPAADDAGDLSVVVQGNLDRHNAPDVANACRHWRALFPGAEVVLAVSGSEAFEVAGGRLAPAARLPALSAQAHAMAALNAACDAVVAAAPALPLPPLKFDDKVNNVNLQIAAARAGLAAAPRPRVLRIRADAGFADAGFRAFHARHRARPRGGMAVLGERVLVCDTYTLNPYTLERLPLHVSDWFHYGRLEDVRALWAGPDYAYADAVHYETRPHAPGSRVGEALFRSRLAAEQHILLGLVRAAGLDIPLDFHNDLRGRRASLLFLRDNVVVADRAECRLRMPKYADARASRLHPLLCVTHADWLALTEAATPEAAEALFAGRARWAARLDVVRRNPAFRALRAVQRRVLRR